MTGQRAWCAIYQWPGRKPFLFGTAWVRVEGTSQEVEAAFARLWEELLPDGIAGPELQGLRPGMVVFQPEEGE